MTKVTVTYVVPTEKTVTVDVPEGYSPLLGKDGKYQFRAPTSGEYYVPQMGGHVQRSCGVHAVGKEEDFRLIVQKVWNWPKELGEKTVKIYFSGDDWYATDRFGTISYLNPAVFPWFSPPTDTLAVKNPNYKA